MNSRVVCIVAVIFVVHSFVYAISTDENDYDSEEDYSEFSNTNSTNSTLILTLGLKNITRSSGKTVKLICEVQNLDSNNTNSKVIFTWKKNEAPIEKDNRIKMRTDKGDDNKFKSTLRITKWEYFDSGFFECIASNGIDKVRSHAFITATPDNNRYGTADMSPLDFGTQNSDKFGEMTTFVPNTISKSESTNFLTTIAKTKKFSPVVEFDYTSTGRITEKMPVYSSNESFCQKYRGVKCRSYLQNMNVFVQPPFTQDEIEEKLDRAFVVISQSNDISTNCNKFAQPSLCFSAFPVCLDATRIQKYQEQFTNDMKYNSKFTKDKFKNIRNNLTKSLRRICKDECTLLENEYCSKEYSIAKTHSVIGQIMELEECEQLPLETHESTDNCLTLGVGDLNTIRDENCYWYNGKFYKGVQDTSKYGNRCMRWSHKFQMTTLYPELAGHNYCRNPDDSEEEPFCFVEQNRKEVCGISKCEYIFGGYAGITLFLTAVIIAIIFYYCYHCKRNKIARNLQNKDLPTVNKNIYGNPGPSSPIEMNTLLPPHLPAHRNHNSNKNSIQSVPQYTYKEVRLLEELGEGAFGKVYKGELKTKSGKIFVAVKSLKENASAKTQADFQREIELISELKHPNIICLLGVVMKQEPMCMLFEFMSEGDLHEFLIGNSPEEGKCLTHDQFLHIAIQIAQGMEYLSGNHYVHRDLAARNCLVSKDMVVKISDFGLSRDMYSCDYYRVQSKSLLPVRWMPPESILYGKFTTESDVWSYGVVLWEIYSYGLQPYYGYNNQEVISMIRSRKLLPCPDACPSYCYSLMVECWAEQAIRRPNFSEIAHRLKVWKQSGTSNGAYYKTSSAQPTPQKYGHCSKSSHTSDSQIGQNDNLSSTWERERQKPTTTSRHDSQSSLTSRTSSVGNNTQSTSVSNEGRRERRSRRNVDSLERLNPKNTVVSCSNGENFETKISQ